MPPVACRVIVTSVVRGALRPDIDQSYPMRLGKCSRCGCRVSGGSAPNHDIYRGIVLFLILTESSYDRDFSCYTQLPQGTGAPLSE